MMPRRRVRPVSSEQRLTRLVSLLIACPLLLSLIQVVFAIHAIDPITRAISYLAAAIFYLAMVVMLLGVVALDLPPLARRR